MKSPQPRERDILRTCLDLLLAKGIWHRRWQSGTTIATYGGKTRAIRFGRKGDADILALPRLSLLNCANRFANVSGNAWFPYPLWIECKAPGEKQTGDQHLFQMEVTLNEGHFYIVVSDVSQLEVWLKERGL